MQVALIFFARYEPESLTLRDKTPLNQFGVNSVIVSSLGVQYQALGAELVLLAAQQLCSRPSCASNDAPQNAR